MTLIVYLLRILTADPVAANAMVAGDDLRMRIFLDRTSLRESRGRRLGVHDRDAHHSSRAYRAAVRVGWLDPSSCPFHRDRNEQWATRGAHGMFAAFNLRWIGPCLPPWVLDIPYFSALAAKRKAEFACRKHALCTYQERRAFWANGRPPKETE